MPRTVRKEKTKKPRSAARSETQAERNGQIRPTWLWVNLALMILALVYAFVAGLHTISDFDTGIHLATGRYVVQNHVVPSTDVLSYTAKGAEWLYPPFADVLFYSIFSAWGYAGLSWFCALTLMAIVACLLRSPSRRESGLAAALAILAVPLLAWRANPRPDLFTHLFLAIFIVLLWSFYRSSPASLAMKVKWRCDQRARLWILPPLMLLWVNFHPGFVAGLGLLFAYLLIECLDLLFPDRRTAVWRRLQLAWPALVTTVFVTLINPYGFKAFKASLLIGNVQGTNLPSNGVNEWASIPLSFASLSQALDWRNPESSFWWLALSGVAVIVLALRRGQFGAVLLMAAALYASEQHRRLTGLFSIIVVVLGSTILTEAFSNKRQDEARVGAKRWGRWNLAAAIAVGALCLLTCVRVTDLISNRLYAEETSTSQFGPGESWWFPEGAAAFINQEHPPGNLFQSYELGGFTAWRMGPGYDDYIDGRFDHMAPAVFTEEQYLIASPPDSPVWKAEANRRNINILLFSLARVSGIVPPYLVSLCQSREWRPVYMDDVSIVLLRNRPENRPWIDRDEVNCQSHNFTPPNASRLELSNFYANVGYIFLQLGRYSEALDAFNHGAELAPEDPSIHLALAGFYEAQQQIGNAEEEYAAAVSIDHHNTSALYSLGRFYVLRGRYAEARPLIATAIQLSAGPVPNYYTLLGTIDVDLGQPQKGLMDFAKAEEIGSIYLRGREDLAPELYAQIAAGRAGAYDRLGELQRAIEFQQEATRRTPESASRWMTLGYLYDKAGERQLAEEARQRATALSE